MKNGILIEEDLIKKDAAMLMGKADVIIENTIRKISYDIILMYWKLGEIICNYKKEHDSKYGDAVVERFSRMLSYKYGRGFGLTNIRSSINFYGIFRKTPTSGEFENVTWSHCREIVNFDDKKVILFYLREVNDKKLTINQLRESLKSKSFERTISNQKKGNIKNKIEKTAKDPLILGISNKNRTEKELEAEIMKNIITFKQEIGPSILFDRQQYKININSLRYRVDIVLYDKENKNFILIDLKINKVTQRDISQMKFYIDYFNKHVKEDTDSHTIGIILCETKDPRIEDNEDIYQIKYLNEIPKEKELLKIINENKVILLKTESLIINGWLL